MLYVKVDEQGNPVEPAKSFEEVKNIFLSKNSILPEKFKYDPNPFGYRFVPSDVPMPNAQVGKKIVPDIPIKNEDDTYTRVWKYVDIDGYDNIPDEILDKQLRILRKRYLYKFADSISPLRWETWSEEDKQIVREWYQYVLDMPSHPSWPRMTLPPLPAIIKGN